MNINIIYATKTGHTEKLARAIGEVIDVEPINISKSHVLGPTDLLFVGLGIYGGRPDQALIDYLNTLPTNQIKGAAIFSSSVSNNDQTELVVNVLRQKGIEVLKTRFSCRGQLLMLGWGHPDKDDIARVKDFARLVMDSIA